MKKKKQQLLIERDDYEMIRAYLRKSLLAENMFSKRDAEYLKAEILNAKIVSKNELPPDVVRLNSTVTIEDEKEKKQMQLKVVTPDKADIKRKMISILAPIGTALIGFRKGQRISWMVPAGKKVFTILDVVN
ncbi:MAG: GreA/GreB family elongation factor [Ginsengibacter sp.]